MENSGLGCKNRFPFFSSQQGRTESSVICKSFYIFPDDSHVVLVLHAFLYIPGRQFLEQKILVTREMPPSQLFTSSYHFTHYCCLRLTLENQVTNDSQFAQILSTATLTLRKPRSPWKACFLKIHLHGSLVNLLFLRNTLRLMIKRRWAFPCSPSSETGWLRMLQYNPKKRRISLIYQLWVFLQDI